MGPFRKVVNVARHERAKTAVRAGSQVFNTVRNVTAIGAAAATLVTGGFFATRDAVPANAPAPEAPPALLAQLKGRLAYDAAFALELPAPRPLPSGAQPTAQIRTRPDGLDLVGPGAYNNIPLTRAVPARYVAELEVAAQTGTAGTFVYWMRSAGSQSYQVAVDVGNELIRVQHQDTSVSPARITQLLPNAIPASGLQRGQPLQLAVAVDGTRYRVFVDGQLAGEVSDARVTVPDATQTTVNIGGSLTRGVILVNSLRVYALADLGTADNLLARLRGQLVYEALVPGDLATPPPLPAAARPTAQVRARGDQVDVTGPGDYAPVGFRRSIPSLYLVELDLAAQAGTEGSFTYTLRSAGQVGISIVVDAANELLRFQLRDGTVTPVKLVFLTPSSVPLPGFAKGRVLHLALAVDDARYRVFLDGALIGDAAEPRLPNPANASQTTMNMGGSAAKGGFTVSRVRVSALNDAPAPSARP